MGLKNFQHLLRDAQFIRSMQNMILLVVTVTPVSYTHLDVYKRQWWDYAPPTPVPVPEEKKLEDRVKELENQNATMADQLTSRCV